MSMTNPPAADSYVLSLVTLVHGYSTSLKTQPSSTVTASRLKDTHPSSRDYVPAFHHSFRRTLGLVQRFGLAHCSLSIWARTNRLQPNQLMILCRESVP